MEKCIKNIVLSNIEVEGDIIELGVFRGRNTLIIGKVLKEIKANKKYIGYDTFGGYTNEDIKAALTPKQKSGLLKNNSSKKWVYEKKKVCEKINQNGLEDYCDIVEGDICKTIHGCKSDKIQIIYVDCNAYLPSITALRSLKNKLQDSSFIVIDEHTIGGETAALREFQKEINGDLYKLDTDYTTGPRIIFHVNISENKSDIYLRISKKLREKYKWIKHLEKE